MSKGNDTVKDNGQIEEQKAADNALAEQKRKDILFEQERMRKWIEEDEPLPAKMACKLSQHIVSKESKKG